MLVQQNLTDISFFKWTIPDLFFFIFVFSIQLTANDQYNFSQWLDSNHGPLELEVTVQPTEPQPLPYMVSYFRSKVYRNSASHFESFHFEVIRDYYKLRN